jgi:hypothetical protein
MNLDSNVPLDWTSLDLAVRTSRDMPKEFVSLGLVDLYWTLVRAIELGSTVARSEKKVHSLRARLSGIRSRNRLGALKPLAWGKVGALLAGMQICSAFGTLANPIS